MYLDKSVVFLSVQDISEQYAREQEQIAMNGTISVKSKMNEGSSFTVSIVSPCVRRSVLEKEKAANTQTSSVQDFSGLAGKHILLCEDHPLNQEIAKALLVGKGMLVQIAEDGQKGLEAFSESPLGYYDCVLMDIRMSHSSRNRIPSMSSIGISMRSSVLSARKRGRNSF